MHNRPPAAARCRTRWTRRRGGPAAALFDPTGYWVAQITEDWKERIRPAAKGDVGSIPVNPAGRREAASWDPSLANSCKVYGIGGVLRLPGRLHITWEGNNLKIESDAGAQTRVLSLERLAAKPGGLQGVSVASWDRLAPALTGFTLGGRGGAGGSLKIVTNQAKPGYLARNGVPYGSNATFTEYWDLEEVPSGPSLLLWSLPSKSPIRTSSTDPTGTACTSRNKRMLPAGTRSPAAPNSNVHHEARSTKPRPVVGCVVSRACGCCSLRLPREDKFRPARRADLARLPVPPKADRPPRSISPATGPATCKRMERSAARAGFG